MDKVKRNAMWIIKMGLIFTVGSMWSAFQFGGGAVATAMIGKLGATIMVATIVFILSLLFYRIKSK